MKSLSSLGVVTTLGLPRLKARSAVLPLPARGEEGTELKASSSEEDASDSSERVRIEMLEEVEVGDPQRSGRDPMDAVGDLRGGGEMVKPGFTLLPPEARREKSSDKPAKSTEGVRACIVGIYFLCFSDIGVRGVVL